MGKIGLFSCPLDFSVLRAVGRENDLKRGKNRSWGTASKASSEFQMRGDGLGLGVACTVVISNAYWSRILE